MDVFGKLPCITFAVTDSAFNISQYFSDFVAIWPSLSGLCDRDPPQPLAAKEFHWKLNILVS